MSNCAYCGTYPGTSYSCRNCGASNNGRILLSAYGQKWDDTVNAFVESRRTISFAGSKAMRVSEMKSLLETGKISYRAHPVHPAFANTERATAYR